MFSLSHWEIIIIIEYIYMYSTTVCLQADFQVRFTISI